MCILLEFTIVYDILYAAPRGGEGAAAPLRHGQGHRQDRLRQRRGHQRLQQCICCCFGSPLATRWLLTGVWLSGGLSCSGGNLWKHGFYLFCHVGCLFAFPDMLLEPPTRLTLLLLLSLFLSFVLGLFLFVL